MPEVPMYPAPGLAPYAREVRAAGLRLHCYVAGPAAAPPLLLVHGLADEADTWRHLIGPLAERYRVVAPDLPGFGRSELPRGACTGAFYARVLAALIGALGLARPVVVGSSMGAAVAQRLALAAPQLVGRLVLVGGCLPVAPAPLAPPVLAMLTPGLGERYYLGLRRSQEAAYETLRPYYADLDALPAEDRAFLRERVWARVWSDPQRRAFFSALRWMALDAAMRGAQFRAAVAASRVPAHLIWGESDHISGRAGADATLALLPAARLDVIPACGHLPQQERPDALLALIDAR